VHFAEGILRNAGPVDAGFSRRSANNQEGEMTPMNRMFLLSLALCTALICQAGAEGPSKNRGYVLPGDTIIPRIDTGQTRTAANGTPLGTFMTFQIMNISASPASVQVAFVGTDGNPLTLKYELCRNSLPTGGQGSCFAQLGADGLPMDAGVISEGTFMSDTLPVGGIAYARTFINGPRVFGYATVLSQPSNGVAVSANFNQQEAKPDGTLRELFTASVPLSTSLHTKFFSPSLDATSTATLAIVSVGGGQVNFRARNSAGTELCFASRATLVGEALAFSIGAPDFLPCAQSRETVIEVTGQALAGVAFTFLGEAFSTQPVYGPVP
jgi:hypothetical protein